MILSMKQGALCDYVASQARNHFPDGQDVSTVSKYMADTLDRVNKCFSAVNNVYFRKGNEAQFNHLNSEQYSMFLYFLSNTMFRRGASPEDCAKIFYLNKVLHGIDVFYEVELPDIFILGHTVGTVLGRAKYSDYLLVQQRTTIGASRNKESGARGDYPVFGKYVSVYVGSSVLGPCNIGDNCKIAAHSVLVDRDLESDSIFFGNQLSSTVKKNRGPDKIWIF